MAGQSRPIEKKRKGFNMKKFDVIAAALVIIGALNWGLAGVFHLDLVATIFGMKFGETSGVSGVVIAGHQLKCQVHGPIDPLLSVIATHHPKTLICREPSLEELFLALYGG